ncbi:tyrosine-type recombinase/integrase [Planotetraspora kaengkrachanensis]|uniref:tyrosine-type recombinase/integrase n=1 Tax=Planotetraspora kaengkrachanensis TaxID=575193 RepID=UPI00194194B4|nr:tyrosine-type recombinase/integrase [Planotetraspora kaengkrachanensis]
MPSIRWLTPLVGVGVRRRRRDRPNDLRHTFASTALAEGVPISEVSRWLGHESITTTVDLYGHLVPEAFERARTALDNAFRSALDVPPVCRRS